MHRNTDRSGLIRNRSRDGLPDPPSGVGGELVTPAVFKLIDRFHQTNIAFLDEIQELQATVGIFFGDRDHQSQVRFNHLFLGATRARFAHAHSAIDLFDLGNRQAGRFLNISDLALQALELFFVKIDFGAHIFLARHTAHPATVAF